MSDEAKPKRSPGLQFLHDRYIGDDPVRIAEYARVLAEERAAYELEEAVDDLVDRWHAGEGQGDPLSAFLGMTAEEYGPFMATAELPPGYRLPDRPKGGRS